MGRPLSTAQPASAPSQPLAWHAGGACHEGSSSEGGCRPWDCAVDLISHRCAGMSSSTTPPSFGPKQRALL